MYLLYADESGHTEDASQKFFVMAGVAVSEYATHKIERDLNEIAAYAVPGMSAVELHGSCIRSGKGVFRKLSLREREQMIKDALVAGVSAQPDSMARVFASVVEKVALRGKDPLQYGYEQMAMRFDLFLRRRAVRHNDRQRGLILFDECSTSRRIQSFAHDIKKSRHAYGMEHHHAEVPVFLDSRVSRLIQLADLVAYGIFRHYEHGDSQYFDLIKDKFSEMDGIPYGLALVLAS